MADITFLSPNTNECILTTHAEVISRGMAGTGVINGNKISAASPATMHILIDAGKIKIAGLPVDVVSADKTLDASNETLDRMDIVYRDASGAVKISTGTPGVIEDPKAQEIWQDYTSPVPNTGLEAGAILGAVFIPHGSTAIEQSQIWMFAAKVPDVVTTVSSPGSDALHPTEQAVREIADSKINTADIVTTVGTPGSDSKVPSEQATREIADSKINTADIVTTVGDPGSDAKVPSEQAVRESIGGVVGALHTHDNKALIDTYTQTEANLADAISKKHAHDNKATLDTYNQSNANLSDAVSKKHTAGTDTGLDTGGSYPVTAQQVYNSRLRTISLIIDNGGYALVAGGIYRIKVDYPGTIQSVELVADQSGSAVIDIWKAAYANLPATVANTITASAKPTLAGSLKSQNTTLTGWTTGITAGDYLYFKVDSASTVTAVTVSLKVLVA